ncbi:MAG: hypothetical protein ACYDCQ_05540 [Dehalococcoidia bacterium]
MAEHDDATEPTGSFWDLLGDVARLQREMGKDMTSWARVYELAGQAMQGNAETLALMADLGRRGERFMREGPPAAVRQAMQLFMTPLGALSAGTGAGPAGPFARFMEAWASATPGSDSSSS